MLLFFSFVHKVQATTLGDAYRSALKTRSTYLGAVEDIKIADEQKSLINSALWPQLSLSSNTSWRDEVTGSGATGSFGKARQHTGKATIDQYLFQGGKEYRASSNAGLNLEISHLMKSQAELALFREVAESFYGIFSLIQELDTLNEQKSLLQKRVRLLQKRALIGRSKPSEVSMSRSQFARVQAEISQVYSRLVLKREELRWLTGLDSVLNLRDEIAEKELQGLMVTESDLKNVPVLVARKKGIEVADNTVAIATGDYFPTISTQGNYYFDRDGVLSNSKWDVSLNVTLPIFEGGKTVAERRVELAKKRKATIEYQSLLRKIFTEFRAGKAEMQSKLETVEKLKLAVKLAKKSFKDQQGDFKKGLISNLDVLRAMDDYLTVRKMYENEKIQTKLSWIRLHLLAGKKP